MFDSGLDVAQVMPLLVFVAGMCVVTVSTVRIIIVSRGMRLLSAALGFVEVSLWLFAIGRIMSNLTQPAYYIAYSTGFALGNYLGITLEEKMALGNVVVRVITHQDAGGLVEALRQARYGVTKIDAEGATGPVQIIFTIVKRKQLENVAGIIKRFNPKAFYSVDDLQSTAQGIFPLPGSRTRERMALEMRRAA